MHQLREAMLDQMRLRGHSLRTQQSYLHAVSLLSRHYDRSPDHLSQEDLQNWILYLVKERNLSAATCRLIFEAGFAAGDTQELVLEEGLNLFGGTMAVTSRVLNPEEGEGVRISARSVSIGSEAVPRELEAKARQAGESCPERAISIED